ncbi:tetratricopeptide repeat protein [Robiginitalea marina]|uniref:Tetratricopeptide repeat protein n=1 Tax=Robiginitalea marina TaxID=2954105 RepID=A0ABT1B1X8_9FLAO|nr:tetratricopeptide repeat protein [Robiginitalea marina]MCO5725917.1 tetratricopeptide repeat protein [Robiginitalea marina]
MRKRLTLLPVLLLAMAYGRGQESLIYTHPGREFQQALDLYHNRQYQAAQNLFQQFLDQSSDAETRADAAYYIANAAVRLNQLGADHLMEAFVENHPESPRRNTAYLDVGNYYFDQGRYPQALKWFQKADPGTLDRKEREAFDFRMGYALYSSGRPGDAEPYLKRVANSGQYGSQAKYYLGYIAYEQDDYKQANERFDQIADQEVLREKLSYYQADMNFKLGNFEQAIEQAKKQLPKADRSEASELNKIIGESYFNLGQYGNAIPYLEQYQGRRGRWSHTDYYLLGYAYYQMKDYPKAIGQFNKIIDGQDAVAQNAYYHLAECYLNLDRKQEALNAFRNASLMEFSPEIRKDALLNYARLSYEIGNAFEPVPVALRGYLEAYPGDANADEVRKLLVDSYLTSRDFQGALELLEGSRGAARDETYQKVAFYRGVEYFLEDQPQEALTLFGKSLDAAFDPIFEARARFWQAEAAYALERYEEALAGYLRFRDLPRASSLEEYQGLEYQIGYAYFKLKEYGKAAGHFRTFSGRAPAGTAKADALMRLGDSYFMGRQYREAMAAYEDAKGSGSPEKDYADYQKALALGFLGREGEKQKALEAFTRAYPTSTLKDDALFELGNSRAQEGEDVAAIQAYDQLLSEYRMSSLVPAALMRKGLVYYNSGRNQEALGVFKEVASRFPGTQEAAQAVQSVKLIYMDLGEVDQYATWVRGLGFVEVSDQELEAASFQAAEKQRLEGNAQRAVKAYAAYLEQFPGGPAALEARFRLGQLYFDGGEPEKALEQFKVVAQSGRGDMAEQSLTRICEVLLAGEDFPAALPYLKKLEEMADITQNRTFAQSNLMKAYFREKDYQQTLSYARKVLENPSLDPRIRSDARLMIARSARETGDQEAARAAYAEVLGEASGAAAAEALYYQAYYSRQDGDLEASNAAVQQLVRDFSTHREWGGKGLLLMARNFDQLDDVFQATYILENVVKSFTDFPDLVSEAGEELARIRAREASPNTPGNPQGN